VVTLGEHGVVAADEQEQFDIRGARVDGVDTTGAGDCFVGYLAAELAAGAALGTALVVGNAAAARSTTRVGAAPATPRRAELGQEDRSARAGS
jgi:ribokinase